MDTSASAVRQIVSTSKPPTNGTREDGVLPHCAEIIPLLEHFFLHEKITGPPVCYAAEPAATPLEAKYRTEFVIATLPDPLHTHFSLLFDHFIEAVQQGAQDEAYEYDSSWLPWYTDESSFSSLKDQVEAEDRREKREDQPGLLLFRSSGDTPYRKALIVFVVGEEATGGIHRVQFENSVAWIRALQQPDEKRTSVAILGPTASGSFPSLADLLVKTTGIGSLNGGNGFAVYSGSASSKDGAETFAGKAGVRFRSFVHDDTTALNWLCQYFGGAISTPLKNVAILSEEETAYGHIVAQRNFNAPQTAETCPGALRIYYPRDISTLRAAYQTQSMFISASGQSNQDNIHKSLPTDLADPSGRQHDTVRNYGGNQTPLAQEAQLLGIVDVLRSHRMQYVIIRSSSTLDPLFLANFLRRDYPEARVVIFNSDLLFQRGQDAMALRGVMTLSSYPLFSWAREWTALPPYDTHSHRVFPENSTEGTYIASRLLLQTLARANDRTPDLNCEFLDKDPQHPDVFVPPLYCQLHSLTYAPIPDYAPPFWTEANACEAESQGFSCRPAIWLSVITRNGTWPLASLNDHTLKLSSMGTDQQPTYPEAHQNWPGITRSMQVLLAGLCCLAVFHFYCCKCASFTAKPAFRAHFATQCAPHTGLIAMGSYLISLMTLLAGWSCGIFSALPGPPAHSWVVWGVVVFVLSITGASIAVNIKETRTLNGHAASGKDFTSERRFWLVAFLLCVAAFLLLWVWPLKFGLLLANRAFIFWRAMHLASGVSPVVPFLSLAVGLYVWFWYALHGLALFGPDRPCLPPLETLGINLPILDPQNQVEERVLKLSMFSQEKVADPAERIAQPLTRNNLIAIAVVFAAVAALMFGLGHGTPVRNLGAIKGTNYGRIFCLCLAFYCSFILIEAAQIWRTWSCARQLLVFLDRMALRRTLAALHGFSWGSIWKMSGNVLDVRYKLLSRQLECLNHLHNSLRLFRMPTDEEEKKAFAGIEDCKTTVNESRLAGLTFAQWYSDNYDNPKAADLKDFEAFQKQIAKTTGIVLTKLVSPASRAEKHSLVQADPGAKGAEERDGPPPSKNELVRNAEELVCLTYLGFAQTLLVD